MKRILTAVLLIAIAGGATLLISAALDLSMVATIAIAWLMGWAAAIVFEARS